VASGVLGAQFIWGEDLNAVAGLTQKVTGYLDSIQQKGMLETVKSVLAE
jgi:tagaturonate reductase